MPPSRYIRLTEEEDARLRQIEQAPYFKAKVRLRAQILRLSHRGSNMQAISLPTPPGAPGRASLATSTAGRSAALRVSSMEGLRATRRVSPRRLEPSWGRQAQRGTHLGNATQLAEALGESFGVQVSPEAVRQHLRSMGYSWKRTRYVPSKSADPEEEREAAEELEALKKGLEKKESSSYKVPR